MPYDVEMPDGTVIEDVPDHLTQADLMRVIDGGPAPLSQQQVDQAALEGAPWYQQAYQGVQEGMQDFTMSLQQLVESDMIDLEMAMEVAPNREALKMALKGIKTSVSGIL